MPRPSLLPGLAVLVPLALLAAAWSAAGHEPPPAGPVRWPPVAEGPLDPGVQAAYAALGRDMPNLPDAELRALEPGRIAGAARPAAAALAAAVRQVGEHGRPLLARLAGANARPGWVVAEFRVTGDGVRDLDGPAWRTHVGFAAAGLRGVFLGGEAALRAGRRDEALAAALALAATGRRALEAAGDARGATKLALVATRRAAWLLDDLGRLDAAATGGLARALGAAPGPDALRRQLVRARDHAWLAAQGPIAMPSAAAAPGFTDAARATYQGAADRQIDAVLRGGPDAAEAGAWQARWRPCWIELARAGQGPVGPVLATVLGESVARLPHIFQAEGRAVTRAYRSAIGVVAGQPPRTALHGMAAAWREAAALQAALRRRGV